MGRLLQVSTPDYDYHSRLVSSDNPLNGSQLWGYSDYVVLGYSLLESGDVYPGVL